VWRRLGAAVSNIPAAELFAAMQSGVIDGVEWIGPWSDLQFGLHNVARYYYYPGIMEPTAPITIGINKAVWESLSEGDRTLLSMAIRAESIYASAEWEAN